MGILLGIILIMFGPPILFISSGLKERQKNKQRAKVFYILAVVYLIVGLGICGYSLNNLAIH